ncbi:PREDICTED: putative lysozyme-like protein, partial [Rhagoletis zephyria]|uniref:putative lysozyme-like protein n=1 Tax=Rhagoletis zephyria TaxID=28612 RepID=UPI0008113E34
STTATSSISHTTCSDATTTNSNTNTTAFLTATSCSGSGNDSVNSVSGIISTSTPHKRCDAAAEFSCGGSDGSKSAAAMGDAPNASLREMLDAAFNPDDSVATTFNPPGSRNLSSISAPASFNKSSSTNNSTGSPVAKRHLSATAHARMRPQSSYSARALVFDDSDQELGASGGSGSGGGGSPRINSKQEASVNAAKSSTGLEILTASPKAAGGDNSASNSSLTTSVSLLRNSNLTKSSSGGLSGSSVSLPGRSYNALLRKISYQHGYSMRSSSN